VGVKNSSSDLLIANCDEFIYYDDLVREEAQKRQKGRRPAARAEAAAAAEEAPAPKRSEEERRQEAFDLVVETLEALAEERDEGDRIWGSMIKDALRRRKPGFNERYYGFRSFAKLLDEAEARGLIAQTRDEKSGGSVVRPVAG
jgi:hypothetical protein